MNKVLAIAACCLAVAACGKKTNKATDDDGAPAAAASAEVSASDATAAAAAAAAQAQADKAVAAANGAGAAPAAANGAQGSTLDASDQKLATGQYYEAAPLKAEPGETLYLNIKSSFKPVLVILDSNKQKMSESTALTPNADGSWSINYSEDFPQGGQYYAIIAAEQVGATGPYSVEFRRGHKIG